MSYSFEPSQYTAIDTYLVSQRKGNDGSRMREALKILKVEMPDEWHGEVDPLREAISKADGRVIESARRWLAERGAAVIPEQACLRMEAIGIQPDIAMLFAYPMGQMVNLRNGGDVLSISSHRSVREDREILDMKIIPCGDVFLHLGQNGTEWLEMHKSLPEILLDALVGRYATDVIAHRMWGEAAPMITGKRIQGGMQILNI